MLEDTEIYQINLDHRTDRWQECLENHRAMGFPDGEIKRLSACLEKGFGALGCTKSHVKAMTMFLTDSQKEYCMLIEDDFDFKFSKDYVDNVLNSLINSNTDFDVIVLSASKINAANSHIPGFTRVFESLTTAGYIVNRKYVPKLLNCFIDSLVSLEKFRAFNPRELVVSRFACDVMWHHLQRTGNWFFPVPAIGVQRKSYSDIEGRVVDYST